MAAYITGFLYTLVLSLWVGGISLFTFIITPAIFSSFERNMAGAVVGKLFPGYFLTNLLLSVAALLLLLFFRERAGFRISLLLAVLAILINCYVQFILHPQVREVKKRIHSFESEPESALRGKFRRLHGVSAVLNLVLLADGVTLLYISRRFGPY
ncbi:MAG: DUF4149 domain-containing protein [Thermodesulfovibrionales bacterium]|jgi:uncharacterized membrane protein